MKIVKFVLATIWGSTYQTSMDGSFYLVVFAAALFLLARLDEKFREEERRNGGYRGHIRRCRRDHLDTLR